jgi:CelD/BcsL family acetyltransferase involved in cellulose biosynthesis
VIAAAAPALAPVGPFRYVATLEDPDEVPRAAWRDLAGDVDHENPFLEPFMLEPALAHLAPGPAGGRVEILLVHAVPQRGEAVLVGLAPLVRRRWRGLPVGCASLWSYTHAYDATPLARRGHERAVAGALLEAAGTPLVELRNIVAEGELHRALLEAIGGDEAQTWGRHARAFLVPAATAEDYRRRIAPRKRKELRRQERRLAELGELTVEVLGGSPSRWIHELCDLEERGWKGRGGTALGSSIADRRFVTEMARGAADQGRLAMLALRLDGRAIAMKLNLLGADRAWAWKIAYDEALARFSPGVLLELANIDWVHAHPRLRGMDSCAAPDHPMIDSLWSERLAFESLLVARSRPAAALVAATPLLRWARRRFS